MPQLKTLRRSGEPREGKRGYLIGRRLSSATRKELGPFSKIRILADVKQRAELNRLVLKRNRIHMFDDILPIGDGHTALATIGDFSPQKLVFGVKQRLTAQLVVKLIRPGQLVLITPAWEREGGFRKGPPLLGIAKKNGKILVTHQGELLGFIVRKVEPYEFDIATLPKKTEVKWGGINPRAFGFNARKQIRRSGKPKK